MEFLYKRLPKDLVYIINDYAKDQSQYDKVIEELHRSIACFWVDCNFFRLEFTFLKKGFFYWIKINNIKVISGDDKYVHFY